MLKIARLPQIFSNRDFLKLWLSQLFSQPAGNMLNFILAIKIYETTKSNFMVSLMVALVSIPSVLFSSTAGVLADSVNRKNILIFSNLLRAFCVVGLIILGDSNYLMLTLAFIIAIISVFFIPAETSSIPTLARGNQLLAANTLVLLTLYTSFLIGFSLAGPLFYWFGNNVYYFLILAFLLATLMDILLPPLDYHLKELEKIEEDIEKSFKTFWEKIKEGVLYIKSSPLLLMIVLQITFVFSMERTIIALVPDLAKNLMNLNISQIGYFLIMPVGAGALVGAYFTNHWKNRIDKTKFITTGILIHAVVLFLLSFYRILERYIASFEGGDHFFWVKIIYVMLLAFVSGLVDVSIIIIAQTMVQLETHHDKRGRVIGNLTTLMNAVGLPLVLIVGYLATVFAVTKVIFALGILTLLVGIISWFANIKKLDPILKKDS